MLFRSALVARHGDHLGQRAVGGVGQVHLAQAVAGGPRRPGVGRRAPGHALLGAGAEEQILGADRGCRAAPLVGAGGRREHGVLDLPAGEARGFGELIDLGLVEGRTPTMNGAQAQGCGPVAAAYDAGLDFVAPVRPDTIAKSLAIGNPADGLFALDVARGTGGSIDAVTEQEITEGIALLAQTTGIFTETAGGVTTAVLKKLAERGDIGRDERVVLYITGDGLKTLDAVADRVEPVTIQPTVADFEAAVSDTTTLEISR